MNASDVALGLRTVVKRYPGGVAALRGVSVEIGRGEQVAVVGPSGSGKTTMLTIMGTLERATSGDVRVGGRDVAAASDAELAGLRAHEIGFVFQSFHLQEAMTAIDNVALGMLYTGEPLKLRREAARLALERVGLGHRLDFRPRQLSGGERQRVAIARAVAKRPAIILADEPTGNLDSASGDEVTGLLHALADDGATLGLITHDDDGRGRISPAAADARRRDRQRRGVVTAPAPPRSAARSEIARLPLRELLGTAVAGLSTRRLRSALSALGIAIGIGAMVAVVGVSSSTQASLLSEIDALGTNLLTVTPGQTFSGQNEVLPDTALPMIAHVQHVAGDVAVYQVSHANVYRTPLVPTTRRAVSGSTRRARPCRRCWASRSLPGTSSMRSPIATRRRCWARRRRRSCSSPPWAAMSWSSSATRGSPSSGSFVRSCLTRRSTRKLSSRWRSPSGCSGSEPIRRRSTCEPTSITCAASADYWRRPRTRSTPMGSTSAVRRTRSQARAAAKGQFTTLLLGLGGVALLVGAIGIANIMVISVLERRTEIGLRRALGATRRHISVQFLTESAMLAAIGGVTGLLFGAGATEVYALTKHAPFVMPLYALVTAPAAGFADRRPGGHLPGRQGRPAQPHGGAAGLSPRRNAVMMLNVAPRKDRALAHRCTSCRRPVPSQAMKREARVVYSTTDGDLRKARDPQLKERRADGNRVKVRREVAGRRGKAVTTVSGVPVADPQLKELAGRLKKRCGVGGSVRDGVIEIQGDHRAAVVEILRAEGYEPVLAGG